MFNIDEEFKVLIAAFQVKNFLPKMAAAEEKLQTDIRNEYLIFGFFNQLFFT